MGCDWKRSHRISGPASSQELYGFLPSSISALCDGHSPDLMDGEWEGGRENGREGGRGLWLSYSLLKFKEEKWICITFCTRADSSRSQASEILPCDRTDKPVLQNGYLSLLLSSNVLAPSYLPSRFLLRSNGFITEWRDVNSCHPAHSN